jgi:hypothetical protein
MFIRIRSLWLTLFLIGLIWGMGLMLEARLAISPIAHKALILLWVILYYGALAAWISVNRQRLEMEPDPRDFVGRPIMDYGLPQPEEMHLERSDGQKVPHHRSMSVGHS